MNGLKLPEVIPSSHLVPLPEPPPGWSSLRRHTRTSIVLFILAIHTWLAIYAYGAQEDGGEMLKCGTLFIILIRLVAPFSPALSFPPPLLVPYKTTSPPPTPHST